MIKPAFGSFYQVAWVTSDMDRSLALFRDIYGIPSFFLMDRNFDAEVGKETGKIRIRIALAKVDGLELELIEPIGGGLNAIYRDVLPADGSYANVFHHVCLRVYGTLDDWESHLANLHPERPIYVRGHVGPGARFIYTDDRAFLGHYVEHLWLGEEISQYMEASVPRYSTNAHAEGCGSPEDEKTQRQIERPPPQIPPRGGAAD